MPNVKHLPVPQKSRIFAPRIWDNHMTTKATTYIKSLSLLLFLPFCCLPTYLFAQTDSLELSVEQLFEWGMKHSLQLEADRLQEQMALKR